MEQNIIARILLLVALQLLGKPNAAQSIVMQQQLWLQESAVNPAASGLYNKYDAYGGFTWLNHTVYGRQIKDHAFTGLANLFIESANSGFGLSYNKYGATSYNTAHWNVSDTLSYDFSNIRLNYNYQFRLKNEHTLSIGTTVAYKSTAWNASYYNYWELGAKKGSDNELGIGFGVIYAAKNWHVGLSFSPVLVYSAIESPEIIYQFESTVLASYTFTLRETTQLTPYLIATIARDDVYTGVSQFSVGFRITDKWFLYGLDLSGFYAWGTVNTNLGVLLFNRLQLLYSPGLVLDFHSDVSIQHAFGLSFSLAK